MESILPEKTIMMISDHEGNISRNQIFQRVPLFWSVYKKRSSRGLPEPLFLKPYTLKVVIILGVIIFILIKVSGFFYIFSDNN